jgi:hypothetical protein
MGSLVSGLFGGKQKQTNTPSPYEQLPDFGQQLLQDITKRGQTVADNYVLTPQQISALNTLQAGNVGAPTGGFNFGKQANQAFGQARDMYGTAADYLAGASPLIDRGASSITGGEIRGSISDFMNPYEDAVIANTTRDINQYGQGLFSNAKSLISDAGASGSNRGNLLAADIAKNLTQQVGDFSSNLRRSGFESAAGRALERLQGDRGRALTGAGLVTNQAGTQGNLASGVGNLGNMLMDARRIMDSIATNTANTQTTDLKNRIAAGDILRGQDLSQLQILQDVFKTIPTAAGSINTTNQPGLFQNLSQIVGNIGGGMQGMAMLSDIRFKENINLIGEEKGFNIYHFNYIGDDKIYSGVMAQEVEQIMPDAISELNGVKYVNYDMLGLECKEVKKWH